MRREQRASPKAAELDHRSRALRCGTAVGLTVAVTVVAHESESVWDIEGRHPYLIEWPTVIAASFLGGLGPGLVATTISTAGILFYWIAPFGEWRVQHPSDLIALALFATSGVLVSILVDLLHQTRAREQQLRRSRETVLVASRASAGTGGGVSGHATSSTSSPASQVASNRARLVAAGVGIRSGCPTAPATRGPLAGPAPTSVGALGLAKKKLNAKGQKRATRYTVWS
jgi:K+-sensing histidine kinase KdpD